MSNHNINFVRVASYVASNHRKKCSHHEGEQVTNFGCPVHYFVTARVIKINACVQTGTVCTGINLHTKNQLIIAQ